jgi:predicted phage baseplate assembly protein
MVSRRVAVIQVQNKNEWEDWQRVDGFENSAHDDPHYTLDPENGEITFGNGQNGRVPKVNQGIRAYFYQTSSGAAGNLPAGLHWRIDKSGMTGIDGLNLQAVTGGRDPEPIEDSKLRAQKEFNTRLRAIASEDFEQLALQTPGLRVARAKALPNYHPEFRCLSMPGSVTVVVVPCAREDMATPGPGEGFLQTVQQHLVAHRLVTTSVHVIAPEYVKISVGCKIFLKKKSDAALVKERVQKALQDFLHPINGGPDKQGWPFGRSVYASEIYQLIDKIEGVDHVIDVMLGADALEQKRKKIIAISPNALVYSGEHQLETA